LSSDGHAPATTTSGIVCTSGSAGVVDPLFHAYRERPPAAILGLSLRYISPFYGPAEARPPQDLDNATSYALADYFK